MPRAYPPPEFYWLVAAVAVVVLAVWRVVAWCFGWE